MPRRFRPPPTAMMLLRRSFTRWRELMVQTLLIALVWVVINTVFAFILEANSLATEVWFVAVFSVIVWFYGLSSRRKTPNLRTTYYEGSQFFLKLFLLFLIWIVYLLPFAIGAFFAQQINLYQFAPSPLEITAASVAWLLLGIVSGYWFVRSFLAPVLIAKNGPIEAVRASWARTKGRAWWATKSILLVGLVATLPAVVLAGSVYLPFGDNQWLQIVINVVVSFVAVGYSVPLLVALAYELEKHGKHSSTSRKAKK